MTCWSGQQILSDINNPNLSEDTQKRLDSRIKVFNNFYIPSMNSQTNNDFENIFIIDRLYKDLDYSQFHFNKLNHKIICLNRIQHEKWGHGEIDMLQEFYKDHPPSSEERSSGVKNVDLTDGTSTSILLPFSQTEQSLGHEQYKKNLEHERFYNIDFGPQLEDYVSQAYPDIDLMITTRVDTDDAIQKNFVDNIQNIVRKTKKSMFIDYRSVISAQVRSYSPPQVKTFKTFIYKGKDGTMMLSTVFEPKEFQKYHCYRGGHRNTARAFKRTQRIEDVGGLYLHWKGNVTKPRLGTSTSLENTAKIKDYFPFLYDYDGKCNELRFR